MEKERDGELRRMRKKLSVLFLALLLCLTMISCGGQEEKGEASRREESVYRVDPQSEMLTILGSEGETVYTREELENLGLEERTYSGRDKKVKNARQFFTFSGVDLGVLLEDAGYETDGGSMKVFCSDGYVREYDLEDLFELYSYQDNDGDDCERIPPMIAVTDEEEGWEYPSSFRLVYGQADYDTETSMDFNMQGWACYVQCIELHYD